MRSRAIAYQSLSSASTAWPTRWRLCSGSLGAQAAARSSRYDRALLRGRRSKDFQGLFQGGDGLGVIAAQEMDVALEGSEPCGVEEVEPGGIRIAGPERVLRGTDLAASFSWLPVPGSDLSVNAV